MAQISAAEHASLRPWRRRLRLLAIPLFSFALAAHFIFTWIQQIPLSLLGIRWREPVSTYATPLFGQRWTLFAPDPPLADSRINIMCGFSDGSTSAWLDPHPQPGHLLFSPAGYIERLNTVAIRSLTGVVDAQTEHLIRSTENASENFTKAVRSRVEAKVRHRLQEQRVAYRLGSHYCDKIQGKETVRVRLRILFREIPKYSHRAVTPDENDYLITEWPWREVSELDLPFDVGPRETIDATVDLLFASVTDAPEDTQ